MKEIKNMKKLFIIFIKQPHRNGRFDDFVYEDHSGGRNSELLNKILEQIQPDINLWWWNGKAVDFTVKGSKNG